MTCATGPFRRCFSPVGVVRIFSAAALLAFAGACGQGDAVGEAIFTPEVVSTAAVPQSENDQVALLADERTACAIDSYESQIHCVDGEGAVVEVFGRARGKVPASLAALPTSRAARRERLGFRSFGQVLSGVSVDILAMLGGETSSSLMTRFDVNIASGEVVREEGSPRGPWDVECGQVIYGIPDRLPSMGLPPRRFLPKAGVTSRAWLIARASPSSVRTLLVDVSTDEDFPVE